MAATKVHHVDEKIAKLQQYATGYRPMDDPFFAHNNTVIFTPFVRLGVYRYDDESLCHKTWVPFLFCSYKIHLNSWKLYFKTQTYHYS